MGWGITPEVPQRSGAGASCKVALSRHSGRRLPSNSAPGRGGGDPAKAGAGRDQEHFGRLGIRKPNFWDLSSSY